MKGEYQSVAEKLSGGQADQPGKTFLLSPQRSQVKIPRD
jgi:hypothetical protein